jgi:hypothetical protein
MEFKKIVGLQKQSLMYMRRALAYSQGQFSLPSTYAGREN